MNDLWNEIYFKLGHCVDKDESEKVYENAFADCLGRLGWLEWKGEIVRQYPVKAGHETKYADIVLMKDDVEQIVVEMKRPSHSLNGEDEAQVFSYMRLLPHQARFGIIVCSDIRIYYDNPKVNDKPELVKVVELMQDSKDGMELLRHLSKEAFSYDDFQDYCLAALKEWRERENLKRDITQLSSEEWKTKIMKYIGRELIEKGYDGNSVVKALECVHVSISVEQPERTRLQQTTYAVSPRQTIHREQDHTKYRFQGNKYGKGRLVQAVIKHLVEQSPNTYVEWINFFSGANACSLPIIEKLSAVADPKRYFVKHNDILTSIEGTKFVVCSQWDINNIGEFLRWAQRKGLKIEVIK